jgi:hypothetical protein
MAEHMSILTVYVTGTKMSIGQVKSDNIKFLLTIHSSFESLFGTWFSVYHLEVTM